jgi:hypothetical protein
VVGGADALGESKTITNHYFEFVLNVLTEFKITFSIIDKWLASNFALEFLTKREAFLEK